MTLRDIRPSGELPTFEAMYKLFPGETNKYNRYSRHRTKDGRVIGVALSITRLVYRGGAASLAVVTNVSDVADIVRRFPSMVVHSSDGICLIADDGTIIYMIPYRMRLLGLTL